jgi:rhodanese-related sulfurtransferase
MDTPMPISTLRRFGFEAADELVVQGAAFIDLRAIDDYLEVHIPGSLGLVYEFGPGMAGRARDCLPLSLPLILLDAPGAELNNAAASLRGKGFTVLGAVEDGVNAWVSSHGAPTSTEVVEGHIAPDALVLDVSDPGRVLEEADETIPVELLWRRAAELVDRGPVAVAAGFGVRAGLALGILERAGVRELLFWKTKAAPPARHLEPYG